MQQIASNDVASLNANRLLDFGCGNMPYRPLFVEHVSTYVGCDLPGNDDADLVMEVPGHVPLESGSVDVVLSSQVLEHVEDPAAYLHEAWRILRTGGRLILSTHGVWRYHPDPTDYQRWTCDGLRRDVTRAGFRITRWAGIMGPEATALQLWQDAVLPRVPKRLRSLFIRFMQWRIERADGRCTVESRNRDACVYVLVAEKTAKERAVVPG